MKQSSRILICNSDESFHKNIYVINDISFTPLSLPEE